MRTPREAWQWMRRMARGIGGSAAARRAAERFAPEALAAVAMPEDEPARRAGKNLAQREAARAAETVRKRANGDAASAGERALRSAGREREPAAPATARVRELVQRAERRGIGGGRGALAGSVRPEHRDRLRDAAGPEVRVAMTQVTPQLTATFGDVRETADVHAIMSFIESSAAQALKSQLQIGGGPA